LFDNDKTEENKNTYQASFLNRYKTFLTNNAITSGNFITGYRTYWWRFIYR